MRRVLTLCLLLVAIGAQAQVNEVLKASQFGGITNVSYNPAIAENRFALDINIISLGVGVENNYIGLHSSVLTHPSLFNDKNFMANQLTERLNGNAKSLFLGVQVQGPLSFLYCFGGDRKNAIGFAYHVNTIVNVDGVSEDLARMAYYGAGAKANSIVPFNYRQLSNQNLSAKVMVWSDYGITYSRVLLDRDEHMVKAGVTGKILLGSVGAYVYSSNVNYRFRNYDTLDITHSDLSYGHSGNISYTSQLSAQNLTRVFSQPSFGADIGMIYEWRPDKENYTSLDGANDWYRHDVNKYKISVGASIIDIGRLRFAKPDNVRNYNVDIQGWDLHKENIHDLQSFDNSIASKDVGFKADKANSFKIWLPTRMNIFVDYEIWKGIGANLSTTLSPVLAANKNQVHYPTSVTLTARYDYKWIGAYLPLSYNQYGNFRAGFGLRLGPLFVTSSDIISVLAAKYVYNVNVQMGLKVSIPNIKNTTYRSREKGCKGNFNNKMF